MAEASRDRPRGGGGGGGRLMINRDRKMTYAPGCPQRQQNAYAGKSAERLNTHKDCGACHRCINFPVDYSRLYLLFIHSCLCLNDRPTVSSKASFCS